MDRHIRIKYAQGIIFDYRLKAAAAELFAGRLQEWAPGAEITVDDYVTDELPVIPCAELWEP